MSRIKAFRFKWVDSWYNVDCGYDAILETSDKGDISILILINAKPYKIPLKEREDEFIEDMKFLKHWDSTFYFCNSLLADGTYWALQYAYDDVSICAQGHEGYPKKFLEFLNILHQKI